MKMLTLSDLYLEQLQDMHSCERQLVKAMPRMIEAATHPRLKDAFEAHLAETNTQLERLSQILEDMGKEPGRKVCKATAGLIEEAAEMIDATGADDVRDACLICAAQKIEHYEIASYGCLRTFATAIGRPGDATILDQILGEERHADESLTSLAMSCINTEALA